MNTVLDTIGGQKLLGQPTNNPLGVETLNDANEDFSADNASDLPLIVALPASAPRTLTLMPATGCPGKWLYVQSTGASTVQVADGGGNIGAAVVGGSSAAYFSNGTSWLKMGLFPN